MSAQAAEVWTVKRLLEWTRDFFGRKAVEEPRFSAETLLAHALGCQRLQLYLRFEQVPAPDKLAAFRGLVQRRAAHEPLGYLTGTAAFYSFEFEVTPAVLIPRPETEMLVEAVVTDAKPYRAKPLAEPAPLPAGAEPGAAPTVKPDGVGSGVWTPVAATAATAAAVTTPTEASPPAGPPAEPPASAVRVLELCTGSGCVACSIAKLLPTARVAATDLSEPALAVAKRNSLRLGVTERMEFFAGDLYAALPADFAPADYLVANPPYISAAEVAKLEPTVRDFEPFLALSGGKDGLDVLRRLVADAGRFLKPGGLLLSEIGWDQGPAATALLKAVPGFCEISLLRDFQGHPRVLRGRYRK